MNVRGIGWLLRWRLTKLRLCILCGVSFALGILVNIHVAMAANEKSFERTFRGTINGKWEIQLTLQSTEPISGSYFYERVKKPIRLEARLGEGKEWVVTEFDEKQVIAGQFVGEIFGRVFSGTWSNADKSMSYPFRLVEIHRQWLEKTSPYRSTEPLIAQAKKGKRDAQFHVAFLYHYGQGGLQQDIGEAVRWYKKAAAQGHARAQFILGNLYLSGHGVKRNLLEALQLIEQAAKSGDQRAKDWMTGWSNDARTRTYYEKQMLRIDVQYAVDLIDADPFEAEMGLKAIDSPAAKVYLAYMYYEGKAEVSNPSEEVNRLLREASRMSQHDYGDVTDTFYAGGHGTLFTYMRELAHDVTVPCEIFARYPREALKAFQPHYGGCRDVFPYVCGEAVLTSAVPGVGEFLTELHSTIRGASCDIGTIRCSIGKGQAVHDTLWNVAPQMFLDEADCLGPCEEDATKLGRLRFKARTSLERFFFEDFFFTKENARKLAHGYLQIQEGYRDTWDELYAECPEQ